VSKESTDARDVITAMAAELVDPCEPALPLLVDYLSTLLGLVLEGRQPAQREIDAFRRTGTQAAGQAISAGSLIQLFSGATRKLWPRLPDVVATSRGHPMTRSDVVDLGALVWGGADAAINSVIQGHRSFQRNAAHESRNLSDLFFSNVLDGSVEVASLVELAEQVAFHPATPHFVAVVDMNGGISKADRLVPWLEASIRPQVGQADLLVTAYDNQLVTVAAAEPSATGQVASALTRVLDAADDPALHDWRAGLGRPRSGLRGIQVSYQDAREALDLARRLDSDERVVQSERLLLYRVLLRDRTAMADLVRAVLSPLRDAHNGAEPLVETLDKYFASSGVLTDAARGLHLSVRAVSYRLNRIRELTGNDVNVPMDRLALHLAVMGARLLDWPGNELDEPD
jgi:sugar diacid utilization regulator